MVSDNFIIVLVLIQTISATLDKKLRFVMLEFWRHSLKINGWVRCNPGLIKKATIVTTCTALFWSFKSYYSDDTAIFFSQEETWKKVQNWSK